MRVISELNAQGRTTVPREVRVVLNAKPGDVITWDIEPDGCVTVWRIQPADIEYQAAIKGSLSEWNTAEDEIAYGRL
jgi:bifunctional DNA-binding transcriptional regulator/antitoxin component of YhaV-PrlF toxin-antitoxin module